MAVSICPKCGSGSFEVVEHSPLHAKFAMLFVQCLYCGAVVGVTHRTDTDKLLVKIAESLNIHV